MANVRILKRFAAVTLACLLAFSYVPARADGVTAIRCGRLLNPVDGSITRNAVIVVSGERIEQVGANAKIPDGARVIDLSAYTVLPGLIDSHTHILLQPEDERGAPPVITKSQAFRTVQGVAAARKDLEAGFTTLRDVDSEGAGFADVAIRDAINRGIIPGPRLLVSTLALTITGGHMNNAGLNPDIDIPGACGAHRLARRDDCRGAPPGEIRGRLDKALRDGHAASRRLRQSRAAGPGLARRREGGRRGGEAMASRRCRACLRRRRREECHSRRRALDRAWHDAGRRGAQAHGRARHLLVPDPIGLHSRSSKRTIPSCAAGSSPATRKCFRRR